MSKRDYSIQTLFLIVFYLRKSIWNSFTLLDLKSYATMDSHVSYLMEI